MNEARRNTGAAFTDWSAPVATLAPADDFAATSAGKATIVNTSAAAIQSNPAERVRLRRVLLESMFAIMIRSSDYIMVLSLFNCIGLTEIQPGAGEVGRSFILGAK
ncbi:MAG: hypothetical protein KKA81_16490 [Bacteroidetes bacterium]|nr:hypothetical protein [Bacteroidota bacterium]